MNIEIIKEPTENKPYLIIYKPSGLPSAPINEQDKNNAFSQAAQLFPELLQVKGIKEIEHGLLHRIDTVTSGLLIIAASQKCYDFLIEKQRNNQILKTYSAICQFDSNNYEGFPIIEKKSSFKEGESFTISSYFRPFGVGRKEVRPVTVDSNKAALNKIGKQILYQTQVYIKKIINEKEVLVECKITNGFRHQVRAHLAWYGLPIKNDSVYNQIYKQDKKNAEEQIMFSATKIEFEYPERDLNSYDRKDTWT